MLPIPENYHLRHTMELVNLVIGQKLYTVEGSNVTEYATVSGIFRTEAGLKVNVRLKEQENGKAIFKRCKESGMPGKVFVQTSLSDVVPVYIESKAHELAIAKKQHPEYFIVTGLAGFQCDFDKDLWCTTASCWVVDYLLQGKAVVSSSTPLTLKDATAYRASLLADGHQATIRHNSTPVTVFPYSKESRIWVVDSLQISNNPKDTVARSHEIMDLVEAQELCDYLINKGISARVMHHTSPVSLPSLFEPVPSKAIPVAEYSIAVWTHDNKKCNILTGFSYDAAYYQVKWYKAQGFTAKSYLTPN